MEPKAPSPAGGPSPESAGPILPSPEAPGEVQDTQKIEKAPAQQEVAKPRGDQAAQAAPVVLPQSLPQPIVPDPGSAASAIAMPVLDDDTPDIANDVDVIEKEWVDKAKQIVGRNAHDPYKQNHTVSLLKADYMKKRYNKDIKVPEDSQKKV